MSSSEQVAPLPASATLALLPLLLPLPPPLLLPPLAELASDSVEGFVLLKHAGIKKAGSEARPTTALDTPTRTIIGIFTSAPLSLERRIGFRTTRRRKEPRITP
jgi:hypothetical protein